MNIRQVKHFQRSCTIPYLAMLAIFVVSRWLFYRAGVRFNYQPLFAGWQNLDVEILKEHLSRGLLNLHSQPPGFSAFLGAVVKLFPTSYPIVLHLCYCAAGYCIYAGLFPFFRQNGISRAVSLLGATFYTLRPSSILYENWLFYEYPVEALLVIAAVLLSQALRSARPYPYFWLFVADLALLCIVRSMFHLLYLGLCVLPLIWAVKSFRQRLLLSVPALLVLALYLKNFIVFGSFAASSWQGMNLARVALARVPDEQVSALIEAGRIPPVKLGQPFVVITDYPEKYQIVPERFRDMPELSQPLKSNGEINLNHFGFLALSRDFMSGAIYLISHYPTQYLRSVAFCCATYVRPTHDYFHLAQNKQAIERYIEWTEFWRMGLWFDGSLLAKITGNQQLILNRPYALSSILYVGGSLLLCMIFTAWSFLGGKSRVGSMRYAYLWICGTLVFVAVIGNIAEIGENNRFRESISALQFALALVALHTALSGCLSKMASRLGGRVGDLPRTESVTGPSAAQGCPVPPLSDWWMDHLCNRRRAARRI
jgi:hypothetical protein